MPCDINIGRVIVMSPLVTVVVPVYNASKYLQQNIESLLYQTLKDIEIIYVDDGSTDNSVEIIESYRKNDARIKLLRQKNMHAGVARNTGMRAATGKYLLFLDADDFFEPEMLKELSRTAETYKTDIVICGFYGYDDVTTSTELTPFPQVKQGMLNRDQIGRKLFEVCDVIPWNKLYSTEFVKKSGVEFQNIINSNDAFFTRITVAVAERIYYLKKRFVHYRYNNTNSLQGTREDAILCFGSAYSSIKDELIRRQIYEKDIRLSYLDAVLEFINVRFDNVVQVQNIKVLYFYLKSDMIPGLFDSIEDIPPSHIAHRIYESDDYQLFLEGEYLLQRETIMKSAPKTSLEYRIGRKIVHLLHVNQVLREI